jgi:ribose/xylose/arabinose/galactoside ABC-type transport system permease subunit
MNEDKKKTNNKNNNIFFQYLKNIFKLRILFVMIVLFIILWVISPTFRETSFILENILRPASIISIISLGMTFILASRGLDLSVGSIAALSSSVGVMAFYSRGLPIWLGIVIGLVIGCLFGLFNAFFITRLRVAPFIVTIATLSIGRGLTLVLSGDLFTYGLPDAFRDIGRGSILGIPTPFLVTLVLYIISYYLFNHTRFGKYACAMGSNESAARVAGINVDRYKVFYYVFIGLLSATAGLIFSSRANMVAVTTGMGYELDAIASVILGGTGLAGGKGSITGSFIGAVILTLLDNGLQLLGINTFIQKSIVGVIIIVGLAYAAWQDEQANKAARQKMTKVDLSDQ